MSKRLRVHLLHPDAKVPSYAHPDDSGMDVYSVEDVVVPGYTSKPFLPVRVRTGISLEVPQGYEIEVRSKSGLAANYGVWVLNSPGTIDEGFRGELEVILASLHPEDFPIPKGTKIAQIILTPVEKADVIVMNDSQRGAGGFGSTGLK